MLCSPLKSTDVSEEYVASIFRDEDYTKQETSMKQAVSKPILYGIVPKQIDGTFLCIQLSQYRMEGVEDVRS
jgi:hypothetical protein